MSSRVVTISRDVAASYIPADALAESEASWQQTAQEAVQAIVAARREYETLSLHQDRQARYQSSYALVEAYKHNAHTAAAQAVAVNAVHAVVARVLGVSL